MSTVERSRNPDINHIKQELSTAGKLALRMGKDASAETRALLAHALRHAADEIEGRAGERVHGRYEHVEHRGLREELVELEKELITLAEELRLEFGRLPRALRNSTHHSVSEIVSHLHVDALELNIFIGKKD